MTSVMFPQYTLLERIADGCIHVIGVTASLVALTVLLIMGVQAQATLWIVAVSIYGLALVAMFTCSAGYNLIVRPKVKAVFRRLDHAAIFIMIAGTYTPFTILGLEGAWEFGLISAVWVIALAGFGVKVLWPGRLEGVSTAIYLLLGWIGVIAAQPFIAAFEPTILILLFVGGLLYSLGTIFLFWRKLPYRHAIWHGFVVAAAAVHYSAVVDLVIHG